jgi:hypothetical protein
MGGGLEGPSAGLQALLRLVSLETVSDVPTLDRSRHVAEIQWVLQIAKEVICVGITAILVGPIPTGHAVGALIWDLPTVRHT